MDSSSSQIKFIIESKLDFVSMLRSSVRASLELYIDKAEAIGDIELALGEAVNNCIIHGLDCAEGHYIECLLSISEKEIEIEIIDDGKQIPEPQLKKMTMSEEEIQDSLAGDTLPDLGEEITTAGLGLLLMRQCFNKLEYKTEDSKNSLTMIKQLTE